MFEGLTRLAIAIEVLAWLGAALGVYLVVTGLGARDGAVQLMQGGAAVGGGLMLALMAQVARAVAHIADTVEAGRNALPAPGGGQAPGRVLEVRHGREVRLLRDGRYWMDGTVYRAESEVRKALNEDPEMWR